MLPSELSDILSFTKRGELNVFKENLDKYLFLDYYKISTNDNLFNKYKSINFIKCSELFINKHDLSEDFFMNTPKKISGDFYIEECKISSLKGFPEVDGTITFSRCHFLKGAKITDINNIRSINLLYSKFDNVDCPYLLKGTIKGDLSIAENNGNIIEFGNELKSIKGDIKILGDVSNLNSLGKIAEGNIYLSNCTSLNNRKIFTDFLLSLFNTNTGNLYISFPRKYNKDNSFLQNIIEPYNHYLKVEKIGKGYKTILDSLKKYYLNYLFYDFLTSKYFLQRFIDLYPYKAVVDIANASNSFRDPNIINELKFPEEEPANKKIFDILSELNDFGL